MLRRVARVLRMSIAVVGLLLLAWMPVGFFVATGFSFPWPISFGGMSAEGTLSLIKVEGSGVAEFGVQFFEPSRYPYGWRHYVLPSFRRDTTVTFIQLPLWLLAFLCLAWPVTSFIIHRRRHKRGFEVQMTNEETRNPNETRSPKPE